MFSLAVEQNAAGSLPSSWHKVGTDATSNYQLTSSSRYARSAARSRSEREEASGEKVARTLHPVYRRRSVADAKSTCARTSRVALCNWRREQNVLDRRIGANEREAIIVLRAYIDA
jgi:hypothetical protein